MTEELTTIIRKEVTETCVKEHHVRLDQIEEVISYYTFHQGILTTFDIRPDDPIPTNEIILSCDTCNAETAYKNAYQAPQWVRNLYDLAFEAYDSD